MNRVRIIVGDAREVLRELPAESVHCVVTSPPYWGLRAYRGGSGMIGMEATFEEHLENLIAVFGEVWRVLREDGVVWLNYGDAYANDGKWGGNTGGKHAKGLHGGAGPGRLKVKTGLKAKDLMLMPARLALQAAGWWIRSEIVWHKPNPMPESVRDRPTMAHEKVFLLTRSARYFYDAEAVRTPCLSGPSDIRKMIEGRERIGGLTKEVDDKLHRASRHTNIGRKRGVGDPSGRNLRNVMRIATQPFPGAHFATFPAKLIEPFIKAGTSAHGVCAVCGAGWLRQVETPKIPAGLRARDGAKMEYHPRQIGGGQVLQDWRDANPPRTVGWSPGCECGTEEVVPATVLDPFAGAGTTGVVAARLGRDAILAEISTEYADMARERVEADNPMFNKVAT